MSVKFFLLICAALLCFSCGHIDTASKYPQMVADIDPYPVGTVNASFDRMFSSKVKQNEMNVIFYPRENQVALEFKHELINYWQFWDEAGRQLFIDALDRYKTDFANRNLVIKYNKSRSVYGKLKGRTEWQSFKFATVNRASPAMELGYRFRDNSPYFSVLQRTAKEESGNNSGNNIESQQFSIYFTRAQADELAAIFDKTYLTETLSGRVIPESGEPGRDVYIEK
jgi:hypothetical protein